MMHFVNVVVVFIPPLFKINNFKSKKIRFREKIERVVNHLKPFFTELQLIIMKSDGVIKYMRYWKSKYYIYILLILLHIILYTHVGNNCLYCFNIRDTSVNCILLYCIPFLLLTKTYRTQDYLMVLY